MMTPTLNPANPTPPQEPAEPQIQSTPQTAPVKMGPQIPKVPEKFLDQETGDIRLDNLIRSYLELEKKLSTMVAAPDTEDGKRSLQKLMGVPDTPDQYELNTDHLPFSLDQDVNQRLHEKGFTPEQAQVVYDLAAEKLVPIIMELASEYEADREVEKLISAFGGQEKWAEMSRQLLAFGKKNLPEDVLDKMTGSYDGVMMLYRMMQTDSGESVTSVSTGQSMSGQPDEKELQSLMRDPKYWRDRDPSTIRKVTEGFQRLYGE